MNADKIWQIAVTSRFEKCEMCHATEGLAGHHVLPRRYTKTRHDIKNGISLCVKCHHFAHAKPKLFTTFADVHLVNRGDFASLEYVWQWRRTAKYPADKRTIS